MGRYDVRPKYKGLEMWRAPFCVAASDPTEARAVAARIIEKMAPSMAFFIPLDQVRYVCHSCSGQCGGWPSEALLASGEDPEG